MITSNLETRSPLTTRIWTTNCSRCKMRKSMRSYCLGLLVWWWDHSDTPIVRVIIMEGSLVWRTRSTRMPKRQLPNIIMSRTISLSPRRKTPINSSTSRLAAYKKTPVSFGTESTEGSLTIISTSSRLESCAISTSYPSSTATNFNSTTKKRNSKRRIWRK